MYERYALVGRNGDLSSLSAKARVDMNGQMHAGNSCIDAEGIGEGQRRSATRSRPDYVSAGNRK